MATKKETKKPEATKVAAQTNTERLSANATTTDQEQASAQMEPAPTPPPNSTPDQAEVIPAAGDPEGSTPSPEYSGRSAEQIAQKRVETKTKAPKAGEADPYEELAKEYAKRYPRNGTFHITTDKQVFLAGDRNLAVLHQGTLKTEEKIHSIIVKH